MLLGILSWTLSALFTLLVAFLLARTLPFGPKSMRLAGFVFLWIFITTAFIFVAGLLGWLSPVPLGMLAFGGIMLFLSLPGTRAIIVKLRPTLVAYLQHLTVWWRNLPKWLRVFTWIFITANSIRFVFLIWALPPFVWDALTYHLTNVAQWVQDARIGVFETPVERIYNAANFEVFTAWFAVFIHHDAVIEAAGLAAYILAGLSFYSIASSQRLNQTLSWVATLAYLSTPALVLAVTGTKNDPMVAALFLFAFAIIARMQEPAAAGETDRPWAPLVLLVITLLYAAGTKAYIAHLIPGLVLSWLIFSFANGGLARSATRLSMRLRSLKDLPGQSRILLLVMLLLALFLGSYWYLRNWIVMGNPFFPYSVQIGQNEVLSSDIGGFQFGLDNLMQTMRLFLDRFGDKQFRIVPDLPYTTGWGWIIYGIGVPAAIWSTIRKPAFRAVLAGFLLSFILLLFSSPTSPWNMRYFVWFPAVLALAVGHAYGLIREGPGWVVTGFRMLFTVLAALNFFMVITYNLISIDEIARMLRLPVTDRHAALFQDQVPEEYREVIEFVPNDSPLGYSVSGNGFIYPLYRADFSQEIVYIPIEQADDCQGIVDRMTAGNTRYLFAAPVHTSDAVIGFLSHCSEGGSPLRERGKGIYVIK